VAESNGHRRGEGDYKARAATAETVHADLRTHRGLSQLPRERDLKVTSIALLLGLTYNVLQLIKLGGLA
jgi:hypothetical protein